jgi:hypothetical protein
MHPRVIAERNAKSRERIAVATDTIASQLKIGSLTSIAEQERRDPAVLQMRELEVVADLLSEIAQTLPAALKQKKVSDGAH